MAEPENSESSTPESTAISFEEFLESVPPSQQRNISDIFTQSTRAAHLLEIVTPQLLLHCTSEMCNGPRAFRRTGDAPWLTRTDDAKDYYIHYVCSNCRQTFKHYAVRILKTDNDGGIAYKYGEQPPFGPTTPTRLLTLLGDQRELFLKGRRCENMGLGIGAFAYYRRVVEHQKNRIIEEIRRVAEKIGAAAEILDALDQAAAETQFSKGVSIAKDAIPQALLINGHNPLLLLHNALSEGLHAQTDEECLDIAQAVRIVMTDLSERLSQALKDEVELQKAVSRLLQPEKFQSKFLERKTESSKKFGAKALARVPNPDSEKASKNPKE